MLQRKLTIDVLTNAVWGGWSDADLETGIGGSEEKLIEWARYQAKHGHTVTIYHNGVHGTFHGVEYKDRREFVPWKHRNVFISFKSRDVLQQSIAADKVYHWTTEIEAWAPSELEHVDAVLTISDFHKSNMHPQDKKIVRSYLWFDEARMDRNKEGKEEGSMLYSASYDRGLEELLDLWPKVQENLGVKKLYVTYGWDFINNAIKQNPNSISWKRSMVQKLKQDGIVELGRLTNDGICAMYWKAQYWVLPLNNPRSELFCLNAVKAQYAGAIPVVRRLGALQETVNEFIDWDAMIRKQKAAQSNLSDNWEEHNRKHVEQFKMSERMKSWKKLLQS